VNWNILTRRQAFNSESYVETPSEQQRTSETSGKNPCGTQKYLACLRSVEVERPSGIDNDDLENLAQERFIARDPENLKFEYVKAAWFLMHHPKFYISLCVTS
jgi:hypothetical protein